jgi:hypothetical protein
MKWIKFAAAGVIVLIFCALIAYAATIYIAPILAPFLYFTYLFFGFLNVGVGALAVFRNLRRERTPVDNIFLSFNKAKSTLAPFSVEGTIGRMREWTSAILAIIPGIILWPARFVVGTIALRKTRDATAIGYLSTIQLSSYDYIDSLATFAAIGVCYLASFEGFHGQGYGRILLVTLGSSVVARHLIYAVSPGGLPARLRRVSTNPYFLFLVILTIDFSSLVLFVTPILDQIAVGAAGLRNFREVAFGLLKFRDLSDLAFGIGMPGPQILAAAVGLTFYSAVAGSLFRIKEFSRSDADLAWLASHNLRLGNFSTALNYLKSIQSNSEEFLGLKAAALLGVNAVSEAAIVAREIINSKPQTLAMNLELGLLTDLCFMFSVPEHVIAEVLRLGVQKQIPDVQLMDYLGLWGQRPRVSLADIAAFSTSLGDAYPLTRAYSAILMGDLKEGTRILMESAPEKPIEKIVRSLTLIRVALGDPETDSETDRKACLDWAKSDLPSVEEWLGNLADPFEMALAFGQLGILQMAVATFIPERLQEITYRRTLLKENCIKTPMAALMVQACELREVPLWKQINAST